MAEGDVATEDLWLSANSVIINGRMQNDLFLLATGESWRGQDAQDGAVLLGGQFCNDVWAIGNTITLTGAVQDHARLLGRMIAINGAVSNSAILAGNSVHIGKTAHMGRDVWAFGENVILEGVIAGDLTVMGKSATLAGNFSGNVRVTAADIVILPQTTINGDLVYSSPEELVLDRGVVLRGKLIREAEAVPKVERRPIISWPSLIMQSWLFVGAFCVGALILFLFPAFADETACQIQNSFWKCALVGFVLVCLVPMACFFLAISLIGAPLALLTMMFFMILTYLSKIVVALVIGGLIVRRRQIGMKALPALGLGLVLLYVAAGTGLAGIIAWFLVVCLGLGGMSAAYLARRTAPTP